MTDEKKYICKSCGFKWFKSGKEYECPTCGSKYISLIVDESPKSSEQLEAGERGKYGGGIPSGPPRACKCPKCGYETGKTRGVPCRNTECPECGTQLCGAD